MSNPDAEVLTVTERRTRMLAEIAEATSRRQDAEQLELKRRFANDGRIDGVRVTSDGEDHFKDAADYQAREKAAHEAILSFGQELIALPNQRRVVPIGNGLQLRQTYEIREHGYPQNSGLTLLQVESAVRVLVRERAQERAHAEADAEIERKRAEAFALQSKWDAIKESVGEPEIPRLIMGLLDRVDALEKRLAERGE